MTVNISECEKEKIRLINNQVIMLQDLNASDDAILFELKDFCVDVKYIVENREPKEVAMYLTTYHGFAYLLSLLSLAIIV